MAVCISRAHRRHPFSFRLFFARITGSRLSVYDAAAGTWQPDCPALIGLLFGWGFAMLGKVLGWYRNNDEVCGIAVSAILALVPLYMYNQWFI